MLWVLKIIVLKRFFEQQTHLFKVMGKKIVTILHSIRFLKFYAQKVSKSGPMSPMLLMSHENLVLKGQYYQAFRCVIQNKLFYLSI